MKKGDMVTILDIDRLKIKPKNKYGLKNIGKIVDVYGDLYKVRPRNQHYTVIFKSNEIMPF